ncbi:unnamed protein product [Closterium sp. NIES-54]
MHATSRKGILEIVRKHSGALVRPAASRDGAGAEAVQTALMMDRQFWREMADLFFVLHPSIHMLSLLPAPFPHGNTSRKDILEIVRKHSGALVRPAASRDGAGAEAAQTALMMDRQYWREMADLFFVCGVQLRGDATQDGSFRDVVFFVRDEMALMMDRQYWREMADLFFVRGVQLRGDATQDGSFRDVVFFVRDEAGGVAEGAGDMAGRGEGMEAVERRRPYFARRRQSSVGEILGGSVESIDWRRTFYLNLICHTDYSLTIAVCRSAADRYAVRCSLLCLGELCGWAVRVGCVGGLCGASGWHSIPCMRAHEHMAWLAAHESMACWHASTCDTAVHCSTSALLDPAIVRYSVPHLCPAPQTHGTDTCMSTSTVHHVHHVHIPSILHPSTMPFCLPPQQDPEVTEAYPNICFAIDSSDRAFESVVLKGSDHCFCVLLSAHRGAAFPAQDTVEKTLADGQRRVLQRGTSSEAKVLGEASGDGPKITLFSGFVSYPMLKTSFQGPLHRRMPSLQELQSKLWAVQAELMHLLELEAQSAANTVAAAATAAAAAAAAATASAGSGGGGGVAKAASTDGARITAAAATVAACGDGDDRDSMMQVEEGNLSAEWDSASLDPAADAAAAPAADDAADVDADGMQTEGRDADSAAMAAPSPSPSPPLPTPPPPPASHSPPSPSPPSPSPTTPLPPARTFQQQIPSSLSPAKPAKEEARRLRLLELQGELRLVQEQLQMLQSQSKGKRPHPSDHHHRQRPPPSRSMQASRGKARGPGAGSTGVVGGPDSIGARGIGSNGGDRGGCGEGEERGLEGSESSGGSSRLLQRPVVASPPVARAPRRAMVHQDGDSPTARHPHGHSASGGNSGESPEGSPAARGSGGSNRAGSSRAGGSSRSLGPAGAGGGSAGGLAASLLQGGIGRPAGVVREEPLRCCLASLSLPWESLAFDLLFKEMPLKVDIGGRIFPPPRNPPSAEDF